MMNMLQQKHRSVAHNERGMASILITMVMMTVIALIVVGFAVISRREQRQTLDRQLNTQAFYAAESGVNDTYKLISGSLAASAPSGPTTSYNWSRNGNQFTPGTCQPLAGPGNMCFTDVVPAVYGWDRYRATYPVTSIPATALGNSATLTFAYGQWSSAARPYVPQGYTAFQVRITMPGTSFPAQIVSLPVTYGSGQGSLSFSTNITMPSTMPTSFNIEWLNDAFAPANGPIGETDANLKITTISLSGGAAAVPVTDLVKSSCANTGVYSPLGTGSALSSGVGYSCVLVDPAPLKLEKKDITDSNAWISPVFTDSNPDKVVIKWSPRSATGNPSSDCQTVSDKYAFPKTRACKYPVLRVDVVDVSTMSGAGDVMLNDKLSTYYFQPQPSGSASISGAALNNSGGADAGAPQVAIVNSCDDTGGQYGSCTVEIRNAGPGFRFTTRTYLRITSLYSASDATITAFQGSNQLKLYNGQVVIDVTGKAQDISRRIQVRIPVDQKGNVYTPAFGVQGTGSICKRYETFAGSFTNIGIPADLTGSDPACRT